MDIFRHAPSEASRSGGIKPGVARKQGRCEVLQWPQRQGHRRIPLPPIILSNSVFPEQDSHSAGKYQFSARMQKGLSYFRVWNGALATQSSIQSGFKWLWQTAETWRRPDSERKITGWWALLACQQKLVVGESLRMLDVQLLLVSLSPSCLSSKGLYTRLCIGPWIQYTGYRVSHQTYLTSFWVTLNHCKPGKSVINFYQYVKCPTRDPKCLDLYYGSIKGA